MKRRYKVLIILAGVIAVTVIAFSIMLRQTEKNLEGLQVIQIEELELSRIEDGTYEGEYRVFPIHVILRVTVSSHEITHIELVKHDNGQGGAAEALLDEIVEKQRIDLDEISGASYSSKVILLAVQDAFL